MKMKAEILDFIRTNADGNVRELAFKASKALGEDAAFALEQIAGLQTARTKLPTWAATEGIIFPPHLSMEQCSSEFTARYKAALISNYKCAEIIDFTGGFGVDFSFMAQHFERCTYVERQSHLCDLAWHNLPLLGLERAKVVCGDSKDVEVPMKSAIFVDPARRDTNGSRTYAISDCTPNILDFIDDLLAKATVVMLKLSPMLDWHSTVAEINNVVKGNDAVREVHILSTANECKELLLVLSLCDEKPLSVHCVNDNVSFSYVPGEVKVSIPELEGGGDYLLVPNASIMKAGCFHELERRFGVRQIAMNSHLFISRNAIDGFPGRNFQISAVSSMNKKELKTFLAGLERANIACRNFPLSPEQLRKRLKIKDGGKDFIFATTTSNGEHQLIKCMSLADA